MRTGKLVIVGAVLPLLLGASIGSITTTEGAGTWAYPMQPTAFLLLSLGLAVSHLLVLFGYLEIARRTTGTASRLATLGGAGTALVAVCEIWSGLCAKTPLDATALTALDTGYAVSSLLILAGTLGAGLALRASGADAPLALPLLVNGLTLLVAIPVRFLASDGAGIAALTIWSLTYVWVGLRLRASDADSHPDRTVPSREPVTEP